MPGENSTVLRLTLARQKAVLAYIDLANDDKLDEGNLGTLNNAIIALNKVLHHVKETGGGIE